MIHAGLMFVAFLGAVAGLSLAFLSQRYWFAQAWKFAGRVDRAAWRKAIRGALIAVLAIIALAALAAVTRDTRGGVSRGSWWTAFFGLVADQLNCFLPVYQNDRRRGVGVEALANVRSPQNAVSACAGNSRGGQPARRSYGSFPALFFSGCGRDCRRGAVCQRGVRFCVGAIPVLRARG